MNIRNEKQRLKRGLRILEMIEQETEKRELHEDTLRTAVYNNFFDLTQKCKRDIEICDKVITRLNERYGKL